ncbi:iron uptake transporter permease EfeU [Cellulomonas sp. KRMCY2]|uniref:iron uptake transporter permease EfeU n=1 Tax=Cellulomonas sp. KRMCY2 TaxID=1304865 RepID=UPI00045E9F55|nr:iron uptake transporter permease EfeU [Cellulomonas sp. KRMCY2]
MIANYLIGLREGLEAALVVGILLAYLVRSGRRDLVHQVWLGVAAAVMVSLAFGAVLTFGPSGLTFEAQELIGGTLSILAVGLITWMIFWMSRTARYLKADLHTRLDDALTAGRWAVLVMTLLAVGREGLETALFLWAAAEATGASTQPLVGAVLGLLSAAALGWALYRGAVSLNLRVFFSWTGLFLVVVAGGVLAYGVHDLQEAGVLPGLNALAFDVSAAVPPQSWYGTLLKGVLNFSPVTTWLELAAWTAYVVPTATLFARTVWSPAPRQGPSAPPAIASATSAPDREATTVAV